MVNPEIRYIKIILYETENMKGEFLKSYLTNFSLTENPVD